MNFFNIFIKHKLFLFSLITFLLTITTVSPINITVTEKQTKNPTQNWQYNIIENHPRLFFNDITFQQVKERAFGKEREALQQMKSRIDDVLDIKIEFKSVDEPDGTSTSNHQFGHRAAESALLFHLYKDEKYLNYAKNVLIELVNYYHLRNNANLNIHWYGFAQISALCAYDWIYNNLTEEEKIEIGQKLLTSINEMIYNGKRKQRFRENIGDYKTGFYGQRVLSWYAGVVFYNAGINDSLANKLLLKGYEDHIALLNFRKTMVGNQGGAATACMEYAFRAYPWAEFNFLHTFNSATGLDISNYWDYMKFYLYYMDWNWLPRNREYGYGDVRHFSNTLPTEDINVHIAQLIHFFGDNSPEYVSLAKRLQNKTKRKDVDTMPFIRLFLSDHKEDTLNNISTAGNQKNAVFFKNMGQIFMRSGVGENDTYATFTAGGIFDHHKHFDNNNFVIYRNGYRTIDTGTRPQPGLHLSHYYCRTVAHNCVTVEMPGEVMPDYWGGDVLPALSEKNEPVPNDGGQCRLLGSKVLSFSENDDYVYIASDATESYHEDKVSLVLRQFVYLLPDVFVVFDKVTSTNPGYKKRWLLHTAAEPIFNGTHEFSEVSEGGKLICRTLIPEDAELKKIGGPGKQFWSGDKNWSLPVLIPEDWNYVNRDRTPPDTHPLLGQWRIEVLPPVARSEDLFLHLIQVGDVSLQSLPVSKVIKKKNIVGLSFRYDSKEYEILFYTNKNDHGGNIKINQAGRVIKNEKFQHLSN